MKHTQTELANKSIHRNQTFADRIDCQEKTFKSDGTEQRRTVGCDEALSGDFVAVRSQSRLCHGPNVSLPASDHDALRPSRFQLKPFRQRSGDHGKSSAGVYKQLNFFATPCRAGQTSLYVKQSHLKSLLKAWTIVAHRTSNATRLIGQIEGGSKKRDRSRFSTAPERSAPND